MSETDTLPEGLLESMPWFSALTLIGDHRVEANAMNRRQGSRKGSKDYDSDDLGDKDGDAEEAYEKQYQKEYNWRETHIRHVFYCCSASRPSAEGDTKEDEKEVKTEELSIIASALASGYVKAKSSVNTSKADLDLLTIGSVNDMFNEKSRDSMEWKEQASQSDFDKF